MVQTGQTKRFNTLEDYERYKASLEVQGTFCPEIEAKYTQGYTPGKNTTPTGFLEFQVRDPVAQAKYSAMSPGWEGVESSESAIARGDYDLNMAEKTRLDLRAKKEQPVLQMPQMPQESVWNCSIQ
jgi:hypothetical protein